jgi:rhodanese-related sulfurtransferase
VSFIVDNWLLILLAISSGTMLLLPTLQAGRGASISANEAVRLINREKAVLVDVGERTEYAALHIAGARNVPLASIEASKDLPSNKALPLVLVCRTGARSARAVAALRKLGFERAVSLAGGTNAWSAANLPVDKSA